MSTRVLAREPRAARRPAVASSTQAEREADRAADRAMHGTPLGFGITASAGGGHALPSDVDTPAGGQALDPALRSTMERSFGHDFGAVRVHADAAAARRHDAAAYTVGQDIVIGAPDAAPHTARGRWLYGHELAHVVQQSRAGAEPAVQRVGVGEWFARLFGGGTFETPELKAYLRFLDDHEEIEGDQTSDNKAREIIKRWRAGDPDFPEPSLQQKQLMLLEMIDGPTLDDDEHAILELLRGSSDSDVRTLIGTAGGEAALGDEFHWAEFDELQAFLADWHAKPGNRPVAGEEIGRGRRKVTIAEIVVNQNTPQTVTLTYSDGRMEANTCSTGKGTCVVEPGSSAGPSDAETTMTDSNWTPNGPHRVQFKQRDHDGINWWTQFNARAIALHEYAPVDGTPLSHGCVRLNAEFAERIFRGALSIAEVGIARATVVRVRGMPQPRSTHDAVVSEWKKDFSQGSGPPRDGGDRELRRHLRLSFGGVNDAELNRRISAGIIPRCGGRP